MEPILVTCYVNPDLDGVAGAMAYAEFLRKTGRGAIAGIIGEPHVEAKYILDRFGIVYPKMIFNVDDFNEVILVDASDLNGIEGKIDPEKVIEIIDHRTVHEADKFPNAKTQIELVGAAATLVAEKFMHSDVEISREAAILPLGGIISNTLNFKGGVTTDRDREATVWLNQTAKLSENFWKELFLAKSDFSGTRLIKSIARDTAGFMMGNKKVSIAQIEMIGAKKLLDERIDEIVRILENMRKKKDLDIFFLNMIELEEGKNFFVTQDSETQKLLEKILNIKFVGAVAERPNLIMRKQVVPLLKAELEK